MRNIFYSLLAVAGIAMFASCNQSEGADQAFDTYLPVKVAGEKNWSILNVTTGEFVCRDEFKNKPKLVSEDLFFVEKDKGRGYECYNVHDLSRSINSEPYYSATYFGNGVSPVVYMDTTIIIVNKKCEEKGALPHNIISAQPFKNGFSVVYTDELEAGLVDTLGHMVIRPQFEVIMPVTDDGFAVTCKKMNDSIYSYSIIDTTLTKYYSFTSEKYDPITGVENGAMAVRKDHKVVYIDKDGNRLFDAGEYIRGTSMCYGIYEHMTVYASETGKMGVMTDQGEKLIRDKYELIIPLKNGNFIAYQNDKCGVIDKDDNKILPFEYQDITKVADNRLVVREGSNKYYIIDEKGNEISKETLSAVALYDNTLKSFLSSLIMVKKPTESSLPSVDEIRKFFSAYSTSLEDIANQIEEWERMFMEENEIYGNVEQAVDNVINRSEALSSNSQNNYSANNIQDDHSFVMEMLPTLQSRQLTENDIRGLDGHMLRLLRNSIFAAHSYIFKSPDLMDFFSRYSWYTPRYEDVSSSLSSVEKHNINFIKSRE